MSLTHRSGNITLLTVFMTATIAFVLLLGDNVRAIHDTSSAQLDAKSEQAFYASQSCLEEAYLQLRKDQNYAAPIHLMIGDADCTVTISPSHPHARDGQITSQGQTDDAIRTVASAYTDAGPSTIRNTTKIFHVMDRSGSMQEDSCVDHPEIDTQAACAAAHYQWGPRLEPMRTAQDAAQLFNTEFMNSGFDQVGLIAFSGDQQIDGHDGGNAEVRQALTSNQTLINSAIDAMPTPSGATNIGWAISLADQNLPYSVTNTRVVILMTDGTPNSWCDEVCTSDRARIAKAHGILIFTIGLGHSLDEPLLENMATKPAWFYRAPTRDKLAEIYAAIAEEVTNYNIGQGSWHER